MCDEFNPNSKKTLSVQDIVRIWTNRSSDTWKLALVQRDAAWDEYRAAKLLDSLLRGYPIGGLLLCQTRESTRVLERGQIARRASVDDQAWQLLDGQQRTLAIAAIFAPSNTEGTRFFLNMSEQLIDLAAKGKDNKIRRYITWQTLTSQESFSSGRRFWIDLGCLGAALLKDAAFLGDERSEKTLEEFCALLKAIDSEFDGVLPGGDATFMQRIQAIKRVWFEELIPIHRVKLESAAEVLQVFTRVNLEGVRTSPADIFFAGVKTCWNDAEELLDGMAQYVKGLDRYDALRLSARVASFQKAKQDLIPLDLNRLKGDQGRGLVDEMKNVVGSMQTNCIRQVGDYFVSGKGLGYAMYFVDKHLLDHVFCWVLQRSRNNQGEFSDHSLSRLAAYLIGATAFRLYPIFGDTFSRLVFEMCFAAEQRGEDFPLAMVLRKVKDRWPNLQYYRTQVPLFQSEEDARELVRARPHLFLSIAQNLPYQLPNGCGLDWDHIYAQSLAHRSMKWRGATGEEHLRYHSDYDLVWKVGNLCGLSAFLNRSAQDKRPIEKLDDIRKYQEGGVGWAPDLFISSQEKEMLLAADGLLEEKKIADGMRADPGRQ